MEALWCSCNVLRACIGISFKPADARKSKSTGVREER